MDNIITKEEKIKEAWGDQYDENIEANGFKEVKSLYDVDLNSFEVISSLGFYYVRPKSLQGIEDNNGWIKIESEDDINLFKDKERDFVFIKTSDCNESKIAVYSNLYKCFTDVYNNEIENVTHYQPIEKPKPPIY